MPRILLRPALAPLVIAAVACEDEPFSPAGEWRIVRHQQVLAAPGV